MRTLSFRSAALLCGCLILHSSRAFCDISSELEPDYSQAVLSYNARDFNQALNILDKLLEKSPGKAEFLELEALALQNLHDDGRSAEAYRQLIAARQQQGGTAESVAPYEFELGSAEYRLGHPDGAENHFEASSAADFNRTASEFFLGVISFHEEKWNEAELHFKNVGTDVPELHASAQFYLGQIDVKTNYPSGATQRFLAARNETQSLVNDLPADKKDTEEAKILGQILDSSKIALEPFDHAGYFGNVALITGYDSNVLEEPSTFSGSSSPTGALNEGTMKETLQAGIGYATSPVKTWQFVPSYRTSYNYNFNQDVLLGQFYTNDLALYLTKNALARTSWGVKVEGIYTMQTQTDSSGSSALHPYSFTVPFGPYWRYEWLPRVIIGSEIDFTPQNYYLDSTLPQYLQRSGLDFSPKIFIKSDQGKTYFNPGLVFVFDSNGANKEYNATSETIELNDLMRINEKLTLTAALDYGISNYGSRPEGPRTDDTIGIDVNAVYKLGPRYSVIGDIQYIDNISSVASLYSYNRFLVSAGIGYSIF